MRSNALLEVGGSPTWTLTEDYALGMELKKYGWHCRYVQEYLAIGEAPDQIRNCYQQRSRWCKVHPTFPCTCLQVTLASAASNFWLLKRHAFQNAQISGTWKANAAGDNMAESRKPRGCCAWAIRRFEIITN